MQPITININWIKITIEMEQFKEEKEEIKYNEIDIKRKYYKKWEEWYNRRPIGTRLQQI